MTITIAALALSATLAAAAQSRVVAQAPAASPAPQVAPLPVCPSPRPRFAAVAVDPLPTINVNTTQHFVIALRVTQEAGSSWSLTTALAKNAPVRADGMRTVPDAAYQNLERKPDAAPVSGGPATELFLFTALAPGTASLTFELAAPGATAPERTTTYTVHVSPDVMIC